LAKQTSHGEVADLGLAVELHQSGKLARAEKEYRRYLAVRPEDPQALMSFGILRAQQGQTVAATVLLEKAVALAPTLAPAQYNLGRLYLEQSRHADAVAPLERALELAPGRAETHNNLANALRASGRPDDAVAQYRAALRIEPGFADAAFNLGLTLLDLQRIGEAIEALLVAARISPGDAKVNFRLGSALQFNGQLAEARKVFEHILAAAPDHAAALCGLATVMRQTVDWQGLDAIEVRINGLAGQKPDADGNSVDPFTLSLMCDDPALMLECAKVSARKRSAGVAGKLPAVSADGRIRLAYVAGDYREHATSYLIADLIESHDRARFEVFGISLGPDDGSPMRRRMEQAFDVFVDARHMTAAATAALMRERRIAIAIDLVGYNQFERMEIFAHRAAPVQAGYLGWPGTTGARFIDYIIADRHVVPEAHRGHFSEAVVQLPDCYQSNDRSRRAADKVPSRTDCGLPQQGFVFCCFNNTAKISPSTFEVWARIVLAVPGSVLWLLDDNPAASANLKREAEARGLGPDRIVLSPRLPMPQHLARHACADLFLDSLPYNAHTTASDALWMGVPVVTCSGRTFQARVAGSLLHAIGLPELIATSVADFEALASALAGDPARLAQIRQKLQANRLQSPLYDTDRLRRHIESAYETMWQLHGKGQAPRAIVVEGT
jgi:predicted O-linked N-acetylglucosamine transferase (SPINDLY family)